MAEHWANNLVSKVSALQEWGPEFEAQAYTF